MPRAGLSTSRVVQAAADLADEIGFEMVTVSVLARRLGIRTPSLYAHVGGADDLRLRMTALALDDSAALVAEAVGGRSGSDALTAYAGAWRGFARRHPGRYAATRHPVPRPSATAARGADDAGALALKAGRRHAALAREVVSSYSFRGDRQTHAVRLLGSLVHGYVTLELAGAFAHSRPGSEQSWAFVLAALDAQLRAESG
jgi:AcrR family transcriptional regulator